MREEGGKIGGDKIVGDLCGLGVKRECGCVGTCFCGVLILVRESVCGKRIGFSGIENWLGSGRVRVLR